MIDENIWSRLIKIIFIFALISSATLNFFQSGVINHQEMAIEHLFKYKKGYIKLMNVLQVSPEERGAFLGRANQDED
jgi:hypothetical protein|tara:strand:- start:544 stop:774 length:231 start_codon:yes stop_codon:yes gene_type:complete